MKKYSESTKNVLRDLHILNERFGDPINLEKLRANLIADWYPYVGNKTELESAASTGTFTWEYAFFLFVKNDDSLWAIFNYLFKIFKKAQFKDPKCFADSFKHFWDSEHKAIRNYADLFHLERDKRRTPDVLSVKVAFQEIGMSLESCVQPFARHFLSLHLLAESNQFIGFNALDKMSFGRVINQLADIPILNSLYKPNPWSISLSQWRNISQHLSYDFDENTKIITCNYGIHPNIRNIKITYPELHYLCYSVNLIFGLHKMAYSIFTLGITDILKGLIQSTQITDDTISATITEILTTHSFEIVSFDWQTPPWSIEVIDSVGHSEERYQQIITELYRVCAIKEALSLKMFITHGVYRCTRTITIGPRPTNVST